MYIVQGYNVHSTLYSIDMYYVPCTMYIEMYVRCRATMYSYDVHVRVHIDHRAADREALFYPQLYLYSCILDSTIHLYIISWSDMIIYIYIDYIG